MPARLWIGVVTIVLTFASACAAEDKTFAVVIQRTSTKDGLLNGKISVNGEAIGTTHENAEKKIPAGTYNGVLRTMSMKNFVQGPGGKLGKSGDFLLEIDGVPKRTDILLHAGNKPEHSEGCVMLGPATKNSAGDSIAPDALKKLRLLFYDGEDSPTATPKKTITVEVKDP